MGIFAYAVKEGRARVQGSPIASALQMVGMSEGQSQTLSGQLTQIASDVSSAVETVDEAAETTLHAATSAVEGVHQSHVAAVSNV